MMKNTSPEPSLVVGIDVSSGWFHAVALDGQGHLMRPCAKHANDRAGIGALIDGLIDPRRTLACLEHTGVYGELLMRMLHEAGVRVCPVFPQLIARAHGKARRAKSDEADAAFLADYARRHHDQLRPWHPQDERLERVGALLGLRETLLTQKAALDASLHALGRKACRPAEAIARCEEARAVLVAQVALATGEALGLLKEEAWLHGMWHLLQSVPGVGPMTAANMLVSTGAFSRCSSARELRSFLGVAPLEHTSGSSVMGRSRSSGFGPRRLRKTLWLAALGAVKSKTGPYRAYYEALVARGKPKKLALNNLANKLLSACWAVFRDGVPFDPERYGKLATAG
jgi:transposase